MSLPQRKVQRQMREARLPIVAQLYKRGYSVRQISEEVKKRLNLKTYSLAVVHKDIHILLDEWRRDRQETMDDALQLELTRIDDTVRELWSQWEKSKEDYMRVSTTKRGAPKKKKGGQSGESGIETFGIEEYKTNIVGLGNPAYISEIRQQLTERRKLLGLYAPEKRDISGDMSFTAYLIESGLLDNSTDDRET